MLERQASPRPPSRGRSFVPREHGAYAQLGFPMLAALACGRPGPASVLLGLSAWALFFAAEPVQVLLGRRGPRARAEEGRRAGGRIVLLGGLAAALGALGLLAGPSAVRGAALVPAVLGVAFVALLAAGKERTAAGEMLAAVALASVAFPITVGAGVGTPAATRALVVWALGLSALVFPVRAIGARRRGHASPARRLLPALGACAVAVGLVGTLLVPADLLALAPLVVASVWLGAAPPAPRQLRRVGWSLVAATLATAGLLVVHARGWTAGPLPNGWRGTAGRGSPGGGCRLGPRPQCVEVPRPRRDGETGGRIEGAARLGGPPG